MYLIPDFTAIDFETTGTDPSSDRIIQVGAVRVRDGKVAGTYSHLVDPGVPVPPAVQRLTGITDGMLRGCPREEEVLEEFLDFAGGPFVAHNAPFDAAFFRGWTGLEAQFFDTLSLSRILMAESRNHRLSSMATELGLDQERAHDAADDAAVTARLFLALQERLLELDPELTLALAGLYRDLEGGNAPLILAAASKAAGRLGEVKAGRFLWSGQRVPEAVAGGKTPAFDRRQVLGALGRGGPVAGAVPGYEPRPQQIRMLAAVTEAFEEGRHLLAEAGTGTGKSLAYLIPAVHWAASGQGKVIIATHTLNLQDQLWKKDLPLLRESLGIGFKAALLKGRTNYLCLEKWADAWAEGAMTLEEADSLAQLAVWLHSTPTGDRAEIRLAPEAFGLWRDLAAGQDCSGRSCEYHDLCFLNRARARAEEADVVVVNHSLVFSDIMTENGVLPPHDYLVFDEAHHLEEVATEHLGLSLPLPSLLDFASSLWPQGKTRGPARHFQRLLKEAATVAWEGRSSLERNLAALKEEAVNLARAAAAMNDSLASLIEDDFGSLLLTMEVREDPSFFGAEDAQAACVAALKRSGTLLASLSNLAADLEGAGWGRAAAMVRSLERLRANCRALLAALEEFFGERDPERIYWIEKSGRDGSVTLRTAALEVGPLLREYLWEVKTSVVMTSATLTIRGSFAYTMSRLGLTGLDGVMTLSVPSPYDYRRQAALLVPASFPLPSEPLYGAEVAKYLKQLLPAAGGGTMVLFTSHRMLRECYGELVDFLAARGIALLGQGIDGPHYLLAEEFKREERSVLFGASSFWEGVDIPGEALRLLVVVKLPFWPPTMPVQKARAENLESQGRSSFSNYALPQAVIRFKQGFGRLIRTSSDSGLVVVLDRRLVSFGYGRAFIESLPEIPVKVLEGEEICRIAALEAKRLKEVR